MTIRSSRLQSRWRSYPIVTCRVIQPLLCTAAAQKSEELAITKSSYGIPSTSKTASRIQDDAMLTLTNVLEDATNKLPFMSIVHCKETYPS